MDKAKAGNMPMDTIERGISKAAGGGDSQEQLEEVVYEGYGPGGIAIILQALTPNRNRTAPEVRAAFAKAGGSLGEAGCVAWNFEPKGVINLEVDEGRAEDLSLLAIDAAAEDVKFEKGYLEIYTQPEALEAVRKSLETVPDRNRIGGDLPDPQVHRVPRCQRGGADPQTPRRP